MHRLVHVTATFCSQLYLGNYPRCSSVIEVCLRYFLCGAKTNKRRSIFKGKDKVFFLMPLSIKIRKLLAIHGPPECPNHLFMFKGIFKGHRTQSIWLEWRYCILISSGYLPHLLRPPLVVTASIRCTALHQMFRAHTVWDPCSPLPPRASSCPHHTPEYEYYCFLVSSFETCITS